MYCAARVGQNVVENAESSYVKYTLYRKFTKEEVKRGTGDVLLNLRMPLMILL